MDRVTEPPVSTEPKVNKRVSYLDGLRGLGSVQVLLLHIITLTFPNLIREGAPRGELENFMAFSPIRFLFDGATAVFIFFYLSGFVLSDAFRGRTEPVYIQFTSRYTRLFLSSLVSCLFTIAMMIFFSEKIGYASPYISDHGILLSKVAYDLFINLMILGYGDASLFSSIWPLSVWIPAAGTGVNPILWTMSIELVGSAFIIVLCYLERRMCKLLLMMSLCFIFLFVWRSYLTCFLIGYAMNRISVTPARSQFDALLMFIVFGLGVLMALCAQNHAFIFIDRLANVKIGIPPQSGVSFQLMLAGGFIFISVLRLEVLHQLFDSSFFRFLGSISFPLYLAHFPVVFYFGRYLLNVLPNRIPEPEVQLITVTLCIILSLLASIVFYKVDMLSMKVSKLLSSKNIRARNLSTGNASS